MTDALLSDNDKMEALSLAYLAAVAAKAGYPPDLEAEAVQTVLAQAELLLAEISSNRVSASP